MTALTVAQLREAENRAIELGDNALQMMYRAGRAAAEQTAAAFPSARRVCILCGSGNNGGDGFVMAQGLYGKGLTVSVVLADGEPRAPAAREYFDAVRQLPIAVSSPDDLPTDADVYVDAVYGIGFHGRFSPEMRKLMRRVNASVAHRVAIDIPSGLDADSGLRDPDAFRAALTVTFIAPKIAMLRADVADLCGDLAVEDIGIACEPPQVLFTDPDFVRECFSPREADCHKGTFGRALAVCGSYGMVGAALMAGEAALRSGVGLLEMAVPEEIYPMMAAALPEAVFTPCSDTLGRRAEDRFGKADAILIGCGCGVSEQTTATVRAVLERADRPLVLDADGINCAALHIPIRANSKNPVVVTPHPAEMARLLGVSTAEVQQDRIAAAERFAAESGAVVVLKGYHTVIAAPGEVTRLNPTGNPGMATGGMGDVLAGMTVSLMAQGLSPYRAAVAATYLHGAAGDAAAKAGSQHGLLPRDLLEALPRVFATME